MAVPSLPADVLDALRRGAMVEAIKRLRSSSGLGLKEAKDAIDAYRRDAGEVQPKPSRVLFALSVKRNAGEDAAAAPMAPGEVPQSRAGLWLAGAVALAVAAYFLTR